MAFNIGTHSGSSQADDILSIAALLIIYPGSKVVRTRDPERLADCFVVVDEGTAWRLAWDAARA